MHLIAYALRVASLIGIVALAGAAPASGQTALTAEATVWFTPGVPGDSAVRAVARVGDPSGAFPGVAERLTIHLPSVVSLGGARLPTCAIETVRGDAFVEGCPAGSQVGSGRVQLVVGPAQAAVTAEAYVINGAAPGEVIVALAQVGGMLRSAVTGQVGPSDDPTFGSTVTFTVPAELRHPGGLDAGVTELDLLLRANAAGPYVAISACPLGVLPFRALVAFDQGAATVPPGPLQANVSATCAAGPPPAMAPMPRSAISPPDVAPSPPAVARFGVKLQHVGGKVVRLRLTGVARDAAVSARCLRRCGRAGKELIASVRGTTARLKRPLRPRSRFELRIGGTDLTTRYARYEVSRRGTSVRRIATGCLDDGGQARACPPPS
jgi:hypothetical protein